MNNAIPISFDPAQKAQLTALDAARETIPWLDGGLLRFLGGDTVLDIKAPGDPDSAPILPGARVAVFEEKLDSVPAVLYSAIFSRDALLHAANPLAVLSGWFEMLRELGTMVIVLPFAGPQHAHHQPSGFWCTVSPPQGPSGRMLSEPGAQPPRAEALLTAPARGGRAIGTTEQGLIRAVRAALPEGSFEVLELGTGTARRPGNVADALDVRLALRKRAALPAAVQAPASGAASMGFSAATLIPFMRLAASPAKTPGMREEGGLLIRDFAPKTMKISRIVVLKMDHLGDFIIGLPAMRELRQRFPDAYIRLICGRWNVATATATGLFDDVRVFDFFTERGADWTGVSSAPWHIFEEAVAGGFDLAIDLRVDEDTRALLGRIDAGLRCGIGSQSRFPLLDIALPDMSRQPIRLPHAPFAPPDFDQNGAQHLKPGAFYSTMETQSEACHETELSRAGHLLLSSGELFLPKGHYGIAFELNCRGFVPGLRGAGIRLAVLANGTEALAVAEFGRGSIWRLSARRATLRFESAGEPNFYEFRLTTMGRPRTGRLRFFGARLLRLDSDSARYCPSELHVGEKLALLVSLIAQRTQLGEAYKPPARPAGGRMKIVIAPFSNSTVRDWGANQYAALAGMLVEQLDCTVEITGAPGQMAQAAALMAQVPAGLAGSRVIDRVGKTKWPEMAALLREADLVICNNSGIAHQAAQLGVRTLAIYSASHQPTEWGPRGPASRAIMMGVACSPCGFERVQDCRHDHLCMKLIKPEAVMAQVRQMLASEVMP